MALRFLRGTDVAFILMLRLKAVSGLMPLVFQATLPMDSVLVLDHS
ncbi:hypothetical protein ACO2RV_14650 [Ancylobacter sp. VNQ12]